MKSLLAALTVFVIELAKLAVFVIAGILFVGLIFQLASR